MRSSSRESRKRQKSLQTQVRTLLDERSDLLVQIQDQTREINVLRRSLGFASSEPLDNKKISCTGGSHLSGTDLKQLLDERSELKAKIRELEGDVRMYKPQSVKATIEYELTEAAGVAEAEKWVFYSVSPF